MKKALLICGVALSSFISGYAVNNYFSGPASGSDAYKKVTGIGGVFFKSKDAVKLREWYKSNLGFNINDYGAVFEWYQGADSTKKGFTQWSPFKETTKYFLPSTKEFMINYRVGNLERLVADLKLSGVTITDTIETYDYGKFVHIMDPEGNKIELWEPNDTVYELMGKQAGYTPIK
jgi:predicted enzyme related to lactoylglutathione lyase